MPLSHWNYSEALSTAADRYSSDLRTEGERLRLGSCAAEERRSAALAAPAVPAPDMPAPFEVRQRPGVAGTVELLGHNGEGRLVMTWTVERRLVTARLIERVAEEVRLAEDEFSGRVTRARRGLLISRAVLFVLATGPALAGALSVLAPPLDAAS